MQRLHLRGVRESALQVRQDVSIGERHRRLRIRRDGTEPGYGTAEPGRVGGHGDYPRVQATEKSGDVFQSRRVEQKDALSGRNSHVLQPGSDGPGLQVQLPVVHGPFFSFPVSQEGVSLPPGLMGGPPAQEVDKGGRLKTRP